METLRKFEKVLEIVEQNGRQASRLIPILQAVQAEYRYLPEEVMTFIATSLGISPASVFGVATFYSLFTLNPKGRYHIRVCNGTACHVKRSMDIHNAIHKRLNLQPGKDTTEDMLFTVETVNCLGACGLAPAMVINEEVYGQLTPERAIEIIEEIINKEEVHELDIGRA
ncbi:MAG: NADH-quinone oxidoreductase subunit NuoE [Syntrophorhabdaceae bacterium]|nr:NADH-quinone oxidoreductase subunit NuoE [Syntrophorhabdaceae bacterium]